MHLPISPRLLACCGFVKPGERVADIGCDHGYLGIHLLLNGTAGSVIASDVNEMPLQSARENAVKFGVCDKMTFFLSDGALSIPHDFDVMVCAGMGADTMISILSDSPWLKTPQYRLILQCQSKTAVLRHYLSQEGWRITNESVLRDGRFLYTVMEVLYAPGHALTPGQCYLSPALLEAPSATLTAYFRRIYDGLLLSVNGQGDTADPFKKAALKELEIMAQSPEFRQFWEE